MSDSKKIESKSLPITNVCYRDALAYLGIERKDRFEHKEKIGKEYISRVRKLPTPMLELIVQEHLDDVQNRDEYTIQEIVSELANRILIEGEDETHIESTN